MATARSRAKHAEQPVPGTESPKVPTQDEEKTALKAVKEKDKSTAEDVTVRQEIPNMLLLAALYMIQGVPLGLTLGSMPFLLQARASYTQIGLFSIAAYPYSFKLFWSPIVDSVYSYTFGRRKSWIIPIQLVSAAILICCADWADVQLTNTDVGAITALFFILVLLAATQDIAVDGWALTLLSKKHVGYASTCQTVGMNIGYFASFTAFLALNDPDFCNAMLRSPEDKSEVGIVTLSAYLKFWGCVYAIITVVVAVLKAGVERPLGPKEDAEDDTKVSIHTAYAQLWGVMKLPAVRKLSFLLVTCRLGMLAAEAAAPLKLLEKGVSKEALAGLVLLEFPCELVSALLAGQWATKGKVFTPWLLGYRVRLVMAACVTTLVYYFPANAHSLTQHPIPFLMLAVCGLATSFVSTLMFTAVGSFYNRISDPEIGGAYMTLLNTIANMGIILPKFVVFALMDWLTVRECRGPMNEVWEYACPSNKADAATENACTNAGGTCAMSVDGFYPLSYGLVVGGLVLGYHFSRLLPRLEDLPASAWRCRSLHSRRKDEAGDHKS